MRVVLTGGPCGGKSTALSQVAERMHDLGVRVFMLPEASTMLFTAGCPFPMGASLSAMNAWEAGKLRLQEALEDEFTKLALADDKPTLMLCDRGMQDSKGYCANTDDWYSLLEDNDWTEEKLLHRYDLVVHLVTAALGAESHFSQENNSARTEDIEAARAVDNKLKEAWKDHPEIYVVDNSTGFAEKVGKVIDLIANEFSRRTTGELRALHAAETNRRCYAIKSGNIQELWPQLENEAPFKLTYTVLSGSSDRVLRRRTKGHENTYILSTRGTQGTQAITRTQRLNRSVYDAYLADADSQLNPVEISRYTLIIDGTHIRIDTVTKPQRNVQVLMFDAEENLIPSFQEWKRKLSLEDVTGKYEYSVRAFAGKCMS